MAITKLKAYPGRLTAFAVDGFDISGTGNEIKFKQDAAVIDATGFGDLDEYGLAGIRKSSFEYKGHFRYGFDEIDEILNQRYSQDADVYVAYAQLGWDPLNPVVLAPTVITKYDTDAKLKGDVGADAMFVTRGMVSRGYQLITPEVFLATGTGNSQVLDDTNTTGATDAGCVAQIHVFSAAGTTPSLAAKVQSSTDNGTTWTDLASFNAFTTKGAQRIELPRGTDVDEQIRASWTVTGTGAKFKALIGFSRTVVLH